MPNKELSKIYEPSEYEDAIYEKWEQSGYFNPDNLSIKKDAKNYSIVMPPANVTGVLHMGHASMLALEDILIRYQRMQGKRTLWLPGTDHAAIATQTKVEKILKSEGLDRHKLGREKFLERVREFAHQSHNTIVSQIKKIGSSCDWSREAYTLDKIRTRAVRSVFKLMYDDGLIYRGERIVNWCPRCHSTLADDEVEYKSQEAKLYTFKYTKDFPFAIATTRPETKIGDTGVAVNPKDERYKKYIGKIYKVNFVGVDLKIKVIADRSVEPEFGTGALGITPAHSAVDWQMAEKNKLPIIKVIDEDGKIKDGFGQYSGKDVLEAREMIVNNLYTAGLMEKEEKIENNLSLCYRCDTPIEPLPSRQWFIDVNKPLKNKKSKIKNQETINWDGKSIKDICLEVVREKKIKIIPRRFEKNYFHWIENLRDWCISRQIWFGHQIPVWYRKNSKFKVQSSKLAEDERISKPEIYVGIEPPKGEGWKQDQDTLDTWFSSGLWTFSTLANDLEQIKIKNGQLEINSDDFKKFHPTNVLETGYDILFFWVARMIIMTTYAVGDIPFYDVYLHGLVLDEAGKKMSKSKGNTINPLDMIEKYGTDATRLSLVIGSSPGSDLRLSEEKVAGFRNFINKLWNISRYIISNFQFQIFDLQLDNIDLTVADRWILDKMQKLIMDIDDDLKNYHFSSAGEKLKEFTWHDLADWYLEVSKFEKNKAKELIMPIIFRDLLKLWHPFIPFVTETIWQAINKEKLLIIEKWPNAQKYLNKELDKKDNFSLIKDIIVAVRNARAKNNIEPSRKIKAIIYARSHLLLLKNNKILIKNLRTGIENLEIFDAGDKIKDAIELNVKGIKVFLIGTVDKEKEKARLEKEIANFQKIIKISGKKLENKEFIAKAPAEIIKAEKKKFKERVEQLNDLQKLLIKFK